MNEKLMNHFNSYFSVDDNNNNNTYYDATSTCVISPNNNDDDSFNLHHDYITNGNIMSGYLLYDCKTYGKVILLYHSKCN